MIHSSWLGTTKPWLQRPGRAAALFARQVVHAALGLPGEPHAVGDVAEGAAAARLAREQPAVVERVDEARRAQEVGEPVGLVGPFRIGDRVVVAVPRPGGEVDLAVLGPAGGALGRVVEVVPVHAARVDRVEELHPLADGDLELADAVAVADVADELAGRLRLRRFAAGLVDRVAEGDDPDRGVAGRADRDGLDRDDRALAGGVRAGGRRERQRQAGRRECHRRLAA